MNYCELLQELRFIDSVRFMCSSLDRLSSNLKVDQFLNLKKYNSGNQQSFVEKLSISVRLWWFYEKLNETSLPSKEAIYSKLYSEGISKEDYLTCT